MNILITGSGGYIGSNLIGRLKDNCNISKIFGVDILPQSFAAENVVHIGVDLSADGWTRGIEEQVDTVVHLAQSKKYRDFPDGAEDMFRINIKSTFDLLEWGRSKKIKKFIFASSGSVYRPKNNRLRETDKCIPTSMYAATKLTAEHLIRQYRGHFSTAVMRIFTVYGPGQKSMLIPNVIEKVKNGEEITLARGKGIFLTPIYIDDCVSAIEKLILTGLGEDEGIVNIAGNEILSLGDIVKILGRMLRIKPLIKLNKNQPLFLTADNRKMLSIMGFPDFIPFKIGIKKFL